MSRTAALRRPSSLDGEGWELGKKIRSLRLQAKMTLQSLAQSVGVSESLISGGPAVAVNNAKALMRQTWDAWLREVTGEYD